MLTVTTGCSNKETIPRDENTVEAPDRNPDASKNLVRVLLIGGSRLLQESVTQLLDDGKFNVQRCVPGVDQAVRELKEQPGQYDMLIVQLFGNSEVHFFEQLAVLKNLAGERRLVLLAWPVKDLSFLASSYKAGVDAYLESSMSQAGFRESLDLVNAGKQIFPSRMSPVSTGGGAAMSHVRNDSYQTMATPAPGAHLSGRELEILRHLANGEPNKVIANDLDITEATVKVHVKGILRKIGAANRTQAAIWAIHNGLNPIFGTHDDARQ